MADPEPKPDEDPGFFDPNTLVRHVPADADKAFWDHEAARLAIVRPGCFNSYRVGGYRPDIGKITGVRGLTLLGWATTFSPDGEIDYGQQLIAACQRLGCCSHGPSSVIPARGSLEQCGGQPA